MFTLTYLYKYDIIVVDSNLVCTLSQLAPKDALTMKLEQVLANLGIMLELGKNFDQIVRGPNIWPRIIDRETAIKALQYGCEEGPPYIVVRTIRNTWEDADSVEHPREIWYEIGSTSHQQNLGFELPAGISGFPKHICIEATLAETLIAEGILWIRGDVDEGQTHCYYTGPGSYYEKNKASLVPHTEQCIAQRRQEILTNHVRAGIERHGAEVVAQISDPVERAQLMLDHVRQGYEDCHLLLPADETILTEIRAARVAA